MGAMFRSEEMALCQLFVQPEAAYASVSELGEAGVAQFRDLNPLVSSFQRKFVDDVKRCDEMERRLNYFEQQIINDELKVAEIEGDLPRAPGSREMSELEATFERIETEILELTQNSVNMKTIFQELTEMRHVLEKTRVLFSESISPDEALGEPADQQQQTGKLSFLCGVIPREKILGFERMLWRLSKGNIFLRQADILEPFKDPSTGKQTYKTVFVVFFQGEQLRSRVKKVCAGFRASMYNTPEEYAEREQMLEGVCTRIEDLTKVMNQTHDHLQRALITIANDLQKWKIMVFKAKSIYHTLNMFNMDITNKCLIAECWIPINDLGRVKDALDEGSRLSGSPVKSFLNVIQTSEVPPTFNRTNKFTQGFQNLIDSYGVASYREANPALYTIITFPFLFAVMFGDAGHGLIMLCFGAFMVIGEKKLAKNRDSEVFNIFFSGRYIILLMGIFSIYTGVVYNDLFSLSMNIFGSQWRIIYDFPYVMNNSAVTLMLDPADKSYLKTPYPLGVDPVWQLSTNKIVFMNSYKMKLSIIFGVLHMIFGVTVGVVNHVHFRNYSKILFEFLPQFLFLVTLFFYLVVLMILKWIMYAPDQAYVKGPTCSPLLLIIFINMFLFGDAKIAEGCEQLMFEGQKELQMALLFIAVISIPVLLFGTPVYKLIRKRNQQQHASDNSSVRSSEHPEGEEDSFGELMIHQAIHTIEYILSTVSHTASYLRLWALSLAHAQLSEILWGKIMNIGLTTFDNYVGGILVFVIFAVWAFFTVSILVMMEGLSAFLHTLRLHWVEFMSKFYEGLGYAFRPFSFQKMLQEEEEDLE